jgi:hypothetical protein
VRWHRDTDPKYPDFILDEDERVVTVVEDDGKLDERARLIEKAPELLEFVHFIAGDEALWGMIDHEIRDVTEELLRYVTEGPRPPLEVVENLENP